jgi:putative phosphoserine phosphatase/1-acylglycerol-3-phosphate O-acyltransferase
LQTDNTAAIFDFDGTLVRGDSFRSFLFLYLRKKGFLNLAALDISSAFLLRKLRLISLAEAKTTCLRCFVGWPRERLHEFGNRFGQEKLVTMIRPGARERIAWHKFQGHTTIIATSAPDIYFDFAKSELGIDHVLASQLEFENGSFSGRFVGGADLFGRLKSERVTEFCRSQGINLESSYVYTDHHSDVDLLKNARFPHVVSPTRRLKKIATQSGWPVLEWG